MNEALNKIIHDSGKDWETQRDRSKSPLLFKFDTDPDGKVFELSLPKGEGHPFWRVIERGMTPEERTSFVEFSRPWRGSSCYPVGSYLMPDEAKKMPVRGYIFNGRTPDVWMTSVDVNA